MAESVSEILHSLLREEEALNRRYSELSRSLGDPQLQNQMAEYQRQAWNRITVLHSLMRLYEIHKP